MLRSDARRQFGLHEVEIDRDMKPSTIITKGDHFTQRATW